jgi:serine/threonine-protein kinase HipA
VIDRDGNLAIAKFPKETDDYSIEIWEAVALRLAADAGISVAKSELIRIADKPVLLSHRFDRRAAARIPFLSALSMMGLRDGERGSYPEIVDAIAQYGAYAAADAAELYRRMVLNVLISNVDDHLRNHGFLWTGSEGWTLSPAYDLNPTPSDVRLRILTTNISLDEGTCELDLVLSVAEYFGLGPQIAKLIVQQVARATATWRAVAATLGASSDEIDRMQSAFEHDDSRRARAL